MAATVGGNVDALKKLFEDCSRTRSNSILSNGGATSGIYLNPSEKYEPPQSFARSSGNHTPPKPAAKPFVSRAYFSKSSNHDGDSVNGSILNGRSSSADRSVHERKPHGVPPTPKPKPIICRSSTLSYREPSPKRVFVNGQLTQPEKQPGISSTGPINLGNRSDSEMSDRLDTLTLPRVSPSKGRDPSPENGIKEKIITPTQKAVKKPPPVPKKPRSVMSGYSKSGSTHVQYKYDQALEEQFGLNVKPAYNFTERWAAYQAQKQQEYAQGKVKKYSRDPNIDGSQDGSVAGSSARYSDTTFTNSSIRSILKKGRTPLGLQVSSVILYFLI